MKNLTIKPVSTTSVPDTDIIKGALYYNSDTGNVKYMNGDGNNTWIDVGGAMDTGVDTGDITVYPGAWPTINPFNNIATPDNPVWKPGKNEDKGGFMLLTLGDFSPFHTPIQFINPPATTTPWNQPWDNITVSPAGGVDIISTTTTTSTYSTLIPS